ncbi:hypothetical protein [Granulicella sp. S156]|uniref:hypothetical protein n=1 Tax=Granulicella sp. S156 TaxID=1747224 RepID=UPI00131E1112|nr:hypothetical protein [Granulicella sp. S156]
MTQDALSSEPSISCSICPQVFPAEDLSQCRECGEFICEYCPKYGCSCVDDDPTIQALRVQLRAGAIEFGQLQAERELMGTDNLTTSQQARLLLLTDIVHSLRFEIDEINRIQDEKDFPEKDQS